MLLWLWAGGTHVLSWRLELGRECVQGVCAIAGPEFFNKEFAAGMELLGDFCRSAESRTTAPFPPHCISAQCPSIHNLPIRVPITVAACALAGALVCRLLIVPKTLALRGQHVCEEMRKGEG